MTTEQQQIRQWMLHGQQDCPRTPQIPTSEVADLRTDLIKEELEELVDAFAFADLQEVADSLADLMVVVLGAACACGLDMEPLLQEVLRSNQTKLVKDGNGNLTVLKNHFGKIMKPATYEPPNLTPIIEHQIQNPLA